MFDDWRTILHGKHIDEFWVQVGPLHSPIPACINTVYVTFFHHIFFSVTFIWLLIQENIKTVKLNVVFAFACAWVFHSASCNVEKMGSKARSKWVSSKTVRFQPLSEEIDFFLKKSCSLVSYTGPADIFLYLLMCLFFYISLACFFSYLASRWKM